VDTNQLDNKLIHTPIEGYSRRMWVSPGKPGPFPPQKNTARKQVAKYAAEKEKARVKNTQAF
jgi:hypothetical protein